MLCYSFGKLQVKYNWPSFTSHVRQPLHKECQKFCEAKMSVKFILLLKKIMLCKLTLNKN